MFNHMRGRTDGQRDGTKLVAAFCNSTIAPKGGNNVLVKPSLHNHIITNFDVLLTVLLSIFISVFNQLDAQNLFHNKFYFIPLHVSSTCAHHQEVKIALHSLLYRQTYSCDDTRSCVMQF